MNIQSNEIYTFDITKLSEAQQNLLKTITLNFVINKSQKTYVIVSKLTEIYKNNVKLLLWDTLVKYFHYSRLDNNLIHINKSTFFVLAERLIITKELTINLPLPYISDIDDTINKDILNFSEKWDTSRQYKKKESLKSIIYLVSELYKLHNKLSNYNVYKKNIIIDSNLKLENLNYINNGNLEPNNDKLVKLFSEECISFWNIVPESQIIIEFSHKNYLELSRCNLLLEGLQETNNVYAWCDSNPINIFQYELRNLYFKYTNNISKYSNNFTRLGLNTSKNLNSSLLESFKFII